jgi:cell fate (sporulation/competence/biofilm development) regulator YlbF (YheA/YmcA/DUF963 family)
MNDIDSSIEQLVTAILESDVYREYDEVRNQVNQYPELKRQINEYRRRNYDLQQNDSNNFEKIDAFEKEFSQFRENPLVSDYLAAELSFCRMMQDINLKITDALNFE